MTRVDRRDFLKLVGVGAGGAATGCYRASDLPEKLIPYVIQPEEITPGLPIVYASTCTECPTGCGIHVRTREGRPIKLEGNPEHPINRGALCARGQASIGRSYHPDRYTAPRKRGADGKLQEIGWDEAIELLAQKLKEAGARTRVLGAPVGPTLDALLDGVVAALGGGRVRYEPIAYTALRTASRNVFGVDGLPAFDLGQSDFVLDFGADALETWLSPVEHQRQIKAARDVTSASGSRARMVYIGPRLSTSAANADRWLPARPGSEGVLALALARVAFDARRAAGQPLGAGAERLAPLFAQVDVAAAAAASDLPQAEIERLGRELAQAQRAVALPPGAALSGSNAVAVQSAVLLLDAVLGAVGREIDLGADAGPATASASDVDALIGEMQTGGVGLLLVHGVDPVYSLPPALGFDAALDKVDFVVSFASLPDQTSERADLILPDHTPLESWGDAAPRRGIRSLIQPSLRPLYATRALGDSLLDAGRMAGLAGLPEGSFREILAAAWSTEDLRAALARGGVWQASTPQGAEVAAGSESLRVETAALDGSGDFVLLVPASPLLYDGRGANLPWLQETPDPVTKVAWQSWAEISRKSAERLGVEEGDVVSVETTAGRVEVPVFVRGGIRDDVVAIALGQGHTVGRWASRDGAARGVNATALLPAGSDEAGGRAWLAARASLRPTGGHQRLARSQREDNKRGRQLGEAIGLAAFAKGDWNAGAFAAAGAADAHAAPAAHGEAHGAGHGGGSHEIRKPFDPAHDSTAASEYRWGMTIDLDRCSGCSACVVACSIENNIPVVGEEAILRNRSMAWLRIERFLGDGDQELLPGRTAPQDREELGGTDVRHSPMLCQQCGAAPCEPVCPVLATYHSEEGLNGMIYNRCIGTRYCANNCSYKVRRFNWFDYGIENWPEPMRLMLNPDVTVRSQGVMEKCTFCVQRIQSARQGAKDAGRPIADGEATPACAQSCPSQAIVFGNLKDEASQAVKQADANRGRAYHALHVLNTRPGITYLAKLIRDEEEHA